MELTFNKVGDLYIAEATVNKDYALHIEKSDIKGFFTMEQRSTADGKYASCEIPLSIQDGYWTTLDYVFSHGFYPMAVRFKSNVPITKAEINEIP